MDNSLKTFPEEQKLLESSAPAGILEVNAHLHTPYSFSAFKDIRQLFSLAKKENISVAGINDFFVADGYDEFHKEAVKSKIFPLFNIEFIGLLKKEQQKGIRVNDPNNPGRCYFSGKGLDYPFHLNKQNSKKLHQVLDESQKQVKEMVAKANEWFNQAGTGIVLDFNEIRSAFAHKLVRERHIAKAIRVAVFEKTNREIQRFDLFRKMFNGIAAKSSLQDIPGLENEIRSILLKSGGKAFVEEDKRAFMTIDEIIKIILDAGGIPCYPLLLDDKNGKYTEYEADPEALFKELTRRNIGCIELITGRNDASHVQRLIEFFNRKNFVILFGTEHNTPEMIALTCNTRGGIPLHEDARRISYEGTCVVAAHQYLRANNKTGYVDKNGYPASQQKEYFITLGNSVIHHLIK